LAPPFAPPAITIAYTQLTPAGTVRVPDEVRVCFNVKPYGDAELD
jgi:hypothetical protein